MKMETLEKGKSKLGEICEILRKETLEPAQNDAKGIVDSARIESQKIIELAHAEAKQIMDDAHAKIEQERKLFENSMDLASKQSFDELRQKVEEHLFAIELSQLGAGMLKEGELVAKLLGAIINAIEKEGLGSNLALAISGILKPEEISKHLMDGIKQKLEKNEIPIESIDSGAVIKIVDKKMRIDVSEQSLKELMGTFLRDSFRQILFKNT